MLIDFLSIVLICVVQYCLKCLNLIEKYDGGKLW